MRIDIIGVGYIGRCMAEILARKNKT